MWRMCVSFTLLVKLDINFFPTSHSIQYRLLTYYATVNLYNKNKFVSFCVKVAETNGQSKLFENITHIYITQQICLMYLLLSNEAKG